MALQIIYSLNTQFYGLCALAILMCTEIVPGQLLLSRADGGPDGSFSMEPHEFKQMVDDIRIVEKALGRVCYEVTEKQKESAVFRRSLFVVKDIQAGEAFTHENVRSIRPGHGLHTRYLDVIIGKCAKKDIAKGMPLELEGIV